MKKSLQKLAHMLKQLIASAIATGAIAALVIASMSPAYASSSTGTKAPPALIVKSEAPPAIDLGLQTAEFIAAPEKTKTCDAQFTVGTQLDTCAVDTITVTQAGGGVPLASGVDQVAQYTHVAQGVGQITAMDISTITELAASAKFTHATITGVETELTGYIAGTIDTSIAAIVPTPGAEHITAQLVDHQRHLTVAIAAKDGYTMTSFVT